MKRVCPTLSVILTLVVVIRAHATTIVFAPGTGGVIYIGADSLESENPEAHGQVCKVSRGALVVVAHAGIGRIGMYSAARGNYVALDSDKYARRAVNLHVDIRARAEWLSKSYGDELESIWKKAGAKSREAFQAGAVSTFVVLGANGHGGTDAYAANISIDAEKGGRATRRVFALSIRADAVFLGFRDRAAQQVIQTPATPSAVLDYLGLMAGRHPRAIGAPYTLLRMERDGKVSVIQAGACR